MADKKLKIFGVLNHLGNNYEILKLAKKYPIKFYYLENNVRKWSRYSQRPEPTTWLNKDEFEWVQCYTPGKYDLAMLHVDQQHTDPRLGKGWLYTDLNKLIQDIPKIVINHGTPMWDEFYTEDMVINGGDVHTPKGVTKLIGMKEKIGDNLMIVNSYESVDRWGWGYPLIHGMDDKEWYDLPKEPRVTLMVSPGGLDKYYNRQLITAIKGRVYERCGIQVNHVTVSFKAQDWDEYKDFLGRSLIYINPTLDSPMPRARTEAMLSGCCVLTSRYHGASDFIEHGVDGFVLQDNPEDYADTIFQLLTHNYKEAVEIGQRGKAKAQKLFSQERYQKDLYNIITQVASGKKPVWNGEKIW